MTGHVTCYHVAILILRSCDCLMTGHLIVFSFHLPTRHEDVEEPQVEEEDFLLFVAVHQTFDGGIVRQVFLVQMESL